MKRLRTTLQCLFAAFFAFTCCRKLMGRVVQEFNMSHICVLQLSNRKHSPFCLFACHVSAVFSEWVQLSFFFPPHSVPQTSALSHSIQACNTAKGEKKRYHRRHVGCNFNLKLKALSQLVSNYEALPSQRVQEGYSER